MLIDVITWILFPKEKKRKQRWKVTLYYLSPTAFFSPTFSSTSCCCLFQCNLEERQARNPAVLQASTAQVPGIYVPLYHYSEFAYYFKCFSVDFLAEEVADQELR